ncbi:MAG TPA: alkaline phosphatase family protein [Polyangiaceae bacterium]|nr:alkaline phosphatase family protein [Polyangiaceae bacterium]
MRGIGSFLLAVGFLSCTAVPRSRRAIVEYAVPQRADAPDPPSPSADAAIVVAIDGVRWQDVFTGNLPVLRRWMTTEGAAIGAPGHGEMWASGPNYLSLPGYTEIFTGRQSACQSNGCDAIEAPTMIDEASSLGWPTAVVSSWEVIDRAAAREPQRTMLSTGRYHTEHAEAFGASLLAGRQAGPEPGFANYRRDAATVRVALDLVGSRAPKLMFIGLGDTDERAHRGQGVQYLEALRAADSFLGELEKRVSARTAILVTSDHGRNAEFREHGGRWPESGRVWLVAKGGGIAARGLLDEPLHHLADIAPTIRCLLGMPRLETPDAGEAIASLCRARR